MGTGPAVTNCSPGVQPAVGRAPRAGPRAGAGRPAAGRSTAGRTRPPQPRTVRNGIPASAPTRRPFHSYHGNMTTKLWADSGDSHFLEPADLWYQIMPKAQ